VGCRERRWLHRARGARRATVNQGCWHRPTQQGDTGRGSLAAGRIPPFGRVRPPRRPALPRLTAPVHSTATLTGERASFRTGPAGVLPRRRLPQTGMASRPLRAKRARPLRLPMALEPVVPLALTPLAVSLGQPCRPTSSSIAVAHREQVVHFKRWPLFRSTSQNAECAAFEPPPSVGSLSSLRAPHFLQERQNSA
jgi:hypothetical protein